jgi:hypothetical protein
VREEDCSEGRAGLSSQSTGVTLELLPLRLFLLLRVIGEGKSVETHWSCGAGANGWEEERELVLERMRWNTKLEAMACCTELAWAEEGLGSVASREDRVAFRAIPRRGVVPRGFSGIPSEDWRLRWLGGFDGCSDGAELWESREGKGKGSISFPLY